MLYLAKHILRTLSDFSAVLKLYEVGDTSDLMHVMSPH